MLLKRILNRLRECVSEFLNPITVQHLKKSEEHISEEIHLTKVEVSTAIISLKAGKAPGKGDI